LALGPALDNLHLLETRDDGVAPSSRLDVETGLTVDADAAAVSFTPVAESTPVPAADGSALIYPEDASHSFALTGGDIEANAGYVVIHDPTAPTAYEFSFMAGDAPAALVLQGDGSVLVQDVAGDDVNVIAPAWAKDATGTSLATHYTVDRNILTQHVSLPTGTAFPVVADPRVACDFVWCTLEFKKSETKTASESAAGAGTVLCGGATLAAGAVVGFVCAAYATAFWITAIQAKNQGDCVAFRLLRIGGSAHPVIIGCYA
jgi:hypothetical protein